MEFTAGPPLPWHVTLRCGTVVELWADGYSIEAGTYVFSLLVRASPEDQAELDVTARTPSDPDRVGVAVARISLAAVQELHTAPERAVDGLCACHVLSV